jgi:hypothetical protein
MQWILLIWTYSLGKDHGNYVSFEECDKSVILCLCLLPNPDSMTVNELKNELRRRKLSNSGKSAELVARLQKWKEKFEG